MIVLTSSSAKARQWGQRVALALTLLAPVLCSPFLCFAITSCARHERPGIPPRHFLLITHDALRADHVGVYGSLRPTTSLPSDPEQRVEHRAFALDDLAADGVIFAGAWSPSEETIPALATLFSARPPVESGVVDDDSRLPRDVPSLTESLRAAGFITAAFVSHPRLDLPRALGRGFDTLEWSASDAGALAAAKAWLARDFGDGARVFLWLHLSGLEPPWSALAAGAGEDPDSSPERFLTPGYQGPVDGSRAFFERWKQGELALGTADQRHLSELYDGRIAAGMGELVSFLRAAFDYNRRGAEAVEFWSRTLVVVVGTHGIELGEHGTPSRIGVVHDELLHVPLFVRHPDSLTGERVLAETVELEDIAPTVLDWFELPPLAHAHGRSLLALTDRARGRHFGSRPAIDETPERVFSVRDGRWRMIWSPARSKLAPTSRLHDLPDVQLFDRSAGLAAREDVAALHTDVVEELKNAVRVWRLALNPHEKVVLGSTRKPADSTP